MAETMRAAVLTGPRATRVVAADRPEPGPGEVRVRLEGCGVCGSNVPVWEGRPWFDYPLVPGAPGHEGWGRVDAIGDDVAGVHAGDRVALLSYRAFAEYDVAPATMLAPLPPALDDVPFPGEALGCASNVLRRSGVEAGMVVAVVGIGFLGAVVAAFAAAAGARVIAITRRASALEIARAYGAAHTLEWRAAAAVEAGVRELTEGAGCDVVIEAVGAQRALDLAARLAATRGRLVIAGYHQDGPRMVDMQLWNWKGMDVVNAHERDPAVYVEGMRAAAAAVAAGSFDPRPLLTHSFALDDIDVALRALDERPDGFMKALVLA
jgi:threonine dehydrogenase-like Zn-dependent dehydrogenase